MEETTQKFLDTFAYEIEDIMSNRKTVIDHYDFHEIDNLVKKCIEESTKREEVERLSEDGVFFRCSNCNYEPEMAGEKDDLLKMNYCPQCGGKFKGKR